ncbi:translation initiation factor IF-3 [Desulfurivibrio alkaliphilus]|uniref:Translation initiation factor IF-3 n=1 Tax=Desulfurivibrio alkaliphilus (strain DSM 19089 / UNIQEM U267 / AHT2) TaxID=589865 RepID=D6Z315_DESAT|nr:translation initiation factor IF-3 [Desulfurivibrio alkaliphilus]ADH85940.1 translation initiation factor IF-3 [Desulfurivibrio alkaliphilus AHT 2]
MKGRRKEPEKKEVRARTNQQIRCDEVRLIDEDGSQLGIMTPREALMKAEESGLDLVEVSPTAKPPVCRIMDYGKYRYELSKKQQDAKKKQAVVEVKEIKLRPKTEKHDLDFKIKNIKKFLDQNNKVKVTLRFRGREIVYADTLGVEVLNRIAQELTEVATVLQAPKMEGRQMTMLVGPNK